MQRWKAEAPVLEAKATEEKVEGAEPTIQLEGVPLAAGGVELILEGAKIRAKRLIFRKVEK